MTQSVLAGPKGHWLLGTLPLMRSDRLQFVEAFAEGGDLTRGRLVGMLNLYMANHPDLIHEILVAKRDVFEKSPFDRENLGRFLGEGLLLSEGKKHAQQRRLMQPAFHYGRIKGYGQTMVDYTVQMLDSWQHGQVRNIDSEMMNLTLNIVTRVLFGAEVSWDDARTIEQALDSLQRDMATLGDMIIPPPRSLPLPINRRIAQATEQINRVVYRIIEQRRALAEESDDLLSMLLHARYDDEQQSVMTDEELRDEVITLLLAGHETTANALTWTWMLLSNHPEVVDQLHAELEQVLGSRLPTVDDLKALKWTEMIIKEALRLYPPAWMLSPRVAQTDVQIGEYHLKKNETVMISPYTIHRNPRWWPNPEQFDPTRWEAELEKQRPRYAYIPFGGGDRICIGNTFAMMEAQLILATMAQHWTLSLYPGQMIEPEPLITLGPKQAVWMHIFERNLVST